MRVLQLNAWMGKIEGNLKRFLEKEKFDVICMQEVMRSEDQVGHVRRLCFDASRIQEASGLTESYYAANWGSKIANGSWEWGNLILSNQGITEKRSEFVNGRYNPETILGESIGNNLNVQIVKLESGVTIVNHHGYWCPQPMGDEHSMKAFEKLSKAISGIDGPMILCGDLNVVHEAPCMRALDRLRDLTYEYKIESTLSGMHKAAKVPCDHIMVSKDVKVERFEVLPELVSDHKPLVLECSF